MSIRPAALEVRETDRPELESWVRPPSGEQRTQDAARGPRPEPRRPGRPARGLPANRQRTRDRPLRPQPFHWPSASPASSPDPSKQSSTRTTNRAVRLWLKTAMSRQRSTIGHPFRSSFPCEIRRCPGQSDHGPAALEVVPCDTGVPGRTSLLVVFKRWSRRWRCFPVRYSGRPCGSGWLGSSPTEAGAP